MAVSRRRTTTVTHDPEENEEDVTTTATRSRSRSRAKAEEEAVPEETGDEASEFDETLISRGWKETKEHRPATGDWTNDFKWDDDPQVVKFLDNQPWSYNQHWVERAGKRSFPCIGKNCPLCDIGVKLSQKIVFPIYNFDADQVQNLQVGITQAETLEGYDSNPKTGPLDRLYWALSGKKGSGNRRSYEYLPVKERDLEEDWEMSLEDAEAAVAEAEIPEPKDAIVWMTRKQLQEIADEISS